MTTKQFPLRVVLTVTTGRLLTEGKGPRDNGISDLYDILNHMTQDSLFTHQLPRANRECQPWLLRWFPELVPVNGSLASLDGWIARDRTNGDEGVKMWLTELKMMFPAIKDVYDVPQIPRDDHEVIHPYDELVQIQGSDEGVILVDAPAPSEKSDI